MSKKINTNSSTFFEDVTVLEVADNIYNSDSFIKEHFNFFEELSNIVLKYKNKNFEVAASVEFNNFKVNICYMIYSSEPVNEFVIEFRNAVKKVFPNYKIGYNSQNKKFIKLGESCFVEDSNNG